MTDETRILVKAVGWLLDYPDEHFGERLESLEKVLTELPRSVAQGGLLEAIHILAGMDLVALREEYSRLFDFNPGTTLEMTYHRWGDARDRGAALAELQRMYREAGWELTTRELPDFLPLLLDFLALAPEEVCRRVLDDYKQELTVLADRVVAASPLHGPVLKVLRQMAYD